MLRKITLLLLLLLLLVAPGVGGAATELENLPYRVSLGPWKEVALVHVTLQELAPGRYQAEFSGAAQGMWGLLSRWLPERFQTVMVLEDGRLKPLDYKEDLQIGGHKVVKEYRFDYQKGLLEHWRKTDDQPSTKRWQIPLKEPIYDPLSLLYNARIGALGPLAPGQSLKIQGIPNPDPQEMTIDLGPETAQGRKVMMMVREKSGNQYGPYFIFTGPQWVPQKAWVRVLKFGKLTGQLLDSARLMPPGALQPAKSEISSRERVK